MAIDCVLPRYEKLWASEVMRYLSVIIDNDFWWDRHIGIIAKVFQKLGMIMQALNSALKRIKLVGYLTVCRAIFGMYLLGMGVVPDWAHWAVPDWAHWAARMRAKAWSSLVGFMKSQGHAALKVWRKKARLSLLQQILEDGIPQLKEVVVSYRTMFNIAQAFSRCFSAINSRSFN